MVEIELKQRPKRATRRREVTLAVVVTLSVAAAALVVARSFSEPLPERRSPGIAIGVPGSPLGADEPRTTMGGGPADTSGPGGGVSSGAGRTAQPGLGAGDPPPGGLPESLQPGPAGADPDDVAGTSPSPPPGEEGGGRDDGLVTSIVDPLLRGLGRTVPAVEPVRRVARGVTTCVDETLASLVGVVPPECLLPVRGGSR